MMGKPKLNNCMIRRVLKALNLLLGSLGAAIAQRVIQKNSSRQRSSKHKLLPMLPGQRYALACQKMPWKQWIWRHAEKTGLQLAALHLERHDDFEVVVVNGGHDGVHCRLPLLCLSQCTA